MKIIDSVIIKIESDDFAYITIVDRGAANFSSNCLIV